MATQVKVFVSYSSKDKDVKDQVVDGLKRTGQALVYCAPEDVGAGERWDRWIQQRISDADVVVLLLSRHFRESAHCRAEAEAALSAREKEGDAPEIVPVVLDESAREWHEDPRLLPLQAQFADHPYRTRVPLEPACEELKNSLQKVVQHAASRQRAWNLKRLSVDLPMELLSPMYRDRDTGGAIDGPRVDKTPRFLYPEATAWAVLALLRSYAASGYGDLLDAALKSCRWLAGLDPGHPPFSQSPWVAEGWVLTRVYEDADERKKSWLGASTRSVFAFDNAICLLALLECCRWFPEEADLKRRTSLLARNLSSLVHDERNPVLAAVCTLDSDGRPHPVPPQSAAPWSQSFGGHLTKVAEALAEASIDFDEPSFRQQAHRLCEKILDPENSLVKDGRFLHGGEIVLHAHLYAAEGLLRSGEILESPRFIDAAVDCVTWAVEQAKNGYICQKFDGDGYQSGAPDRTYRTDCLAQLLSLGSRCVQRGRLSPECETQLAAICEALRSLHSGNGWRFGHLTDNRQCDSTHSWPTSFAVIAMLDHWFAVRSRDAGLVVLAGGTGARAWPQTSELKPKPLNPFLPGRTSCLQATVRRFIEGGVARPENTFVVCGADRRTEVHGQLANWRIPEHNIFEESAAKGSLEAFKHALKSITPAKTRSFRSVAVSMSDGDFWPQAGFSAAFARALDAAAFSDSICAVGVPTPRWSEERSHYGFYELAASGRRVSGVQAATRFIEKPTDDPKFDRDSPLACDAGCLSFSQECAQRILSVNGTDLARHVLESSDFYKQVAVTPPRLSFTDLGVPGAEMHGHLARTPVGLPGRNVALGSAADNIVFCGSHANTAYAEGGREVYLLNLSGFVVIDSEREPEVSAVVPLAETKSLPEFASLHDSARGYQLTKNITVHIGQVFGSSPHPIQATRGSTATVVAGADWVKHVAPALAKETLESKLLPPNLRRLLRAKRRDPVLLQHLMDVTVVAFLFAKTFPRLPTTAEQLLLYLCMAHDSGGVLSGPMLQAEQQLLHLLGLHSRFKDNKTFDSRILQRLLQQTVGDLSVDEQRMVGRLNDSVESALLLLSDEVRFFDGWQRSQEIQRDRLLFMVAKQDDRQAIRKHLKDFEGHDLSLDDMMQTYACYKAADVWTNAQWCVKWEEGRYQDDWASVVLLVDDFVMQAGLDKAQRKTLAEFILLEVKDENSELLDYTNRMLRVRLPGGAAVPADPSDLVLRHILNREGPSEAIQSELWSSFNQSDERQQGLLHRFEAHCGKLLALELKGGDMDLLDADLAAQYSDLTRDWSARRRAGAAGSH